MNEEEARELGQTMRRNVISELHLMASREEQLKYQRDVPIAFVTAELFCLWDESFQSEWMEEDYYLGAFSIQELQALREFDDVVEDVLSQLSEDLPSIEKFVLTPQSQQLAQAATKTLSIFQS